MTDIAERLHVIRDQLRTGRFGQREVWEEWLTEAAAEIERLRNDYGILKRDYDALREQLAALQASSGYEASIAQVEVEHLRTTLGYLADNINEPALVAVAEAALKSKP